MSSIEEYIPKIKICGLFREEDIQAVNESLPDYCGFVIDFPKSAVPAIFVAKAETPIPTPHPNKAPAAPPITIPPKTHFHLSPLGML